MTTNKLLLTGLGFGLAALLTTACGNEEPTTADYDQTASEIAALAADDNGGERVLLTGAIELGRSGESGGLDLDLNGSFAGRRGSLDVTADIECRDAAGETMDRCGAGTDEATYDLEIQGELETPRQTAKLDRSAHWELAGLTGDVSTIDGDSALDVEHTQEIGDAIRWNTLEATVSYEDVAVRNKDHTMIAGTIRYSIDLARGTDGTAADRERVLSMDAVLEIDGDNRALLTLDGERTYELDLKTGKMAGGDMGTTQQQ